jgi:hypothetical protein
MLLRQGGSDADFKAHGLQGPDPPAGVLFLLISSRKQKTAIFLIPDPGIFDKTNAFGLQFLPDSCPDALAGIKVQATVRWSADQDMVYCLLFGYPCRFMIMFVHVFQQCLFQSKIIRNVNKRPLFLTHRLVNIKDLSSDKPFLMR